MDIQQLNQGLQQGLQQPQTQFFNPQQQPQTLQQPGQVQIPGQIGLEGNVLRIPLRFNLMGINVKCFIEHKLTTGTLQEAYSVLQWYINNNWPVDCWQERQQEQFQQQGQGYGVQGGYPPQRQGGYNNGYNQGGGYRRNYRRY